MSQFTSAATVTNGQSSVTSFADAAAALKHADKLIAEELGKRYVETA